MDRPYSHALCERNDMQIATPTTPTRMPFAEFFAQYGIVLVVLVVAMTILSPMLRERQQLFLTPRNIIQVLLQAATCLWRPPNQPSDVLASGGNRFLREGAARAGLS